MCCQGAVISSQKGFALAEKTKGNVAEILYQGGAKSTAPAKIILASQSKHDERLQALC